MLITLQECLLYLGWEQYAFLELSLLLELLVPCIQVGGEVFRRNHLNAGARSLWYRGRRHRIRQAVRILESVVLNRRQEVGLALVGDCVHLARLMALVKYTALSTAILADPHRGRQDFAEPSRGVLIELVSDPFALLDTHQARQRLPLLDTSGPRSLLLEHVLLFL